MVSTDSGCSARGLPIATVAIRRVGRPLRTGEIVTVFQPQSRKPEISRGLPPFAVFGGPSLLQHIYNWRGHKMSY